MSVELVISVRRPPGSAHVYRLGHDEIRVGRSPECHVRLPDPAVSAMHLVFRRTAEGFEMLDPGSKHGVQVGRTRLRPGEPRPVEHADIVSVGPFTVEVFLEPAAGSKTDHVETRRLAHALAVEEAVRRQAPWQIWVREGQHAGEVLTATANHPVCVDAQGAALASEDAVDGAVAVRFTLNKDGALVAESRGHGARARGRPLTIASLGHGDRLEVGETVLEVRAGAPVEHPGEVWGWSPLELSMLVGIGLALTAALVAWWAA